MSVFDLFGKRNRRFVSEEAFESNLARQASMCSQVLNVLREHGITEQAQLKLEYFFYTDSGHKASALAEALQQKGYSAEHRPSADGSGTLVITGWTTKMPTDETTVVAWTKAMCRLGFEHDCEFDGWDTSLEQA